MSKEYYYLVRWTEKEGWTMAPDIEADVLPDGTIFDVEAGEWQLPYLGDGEFNGKEKALADDLNDMLDQSNLSKFHQLLQGESE